MLFPAAVATDRGGVIPTAHLQALQDAGLYGIFSTESVGGSNLSNADRDLVIEALAGGCLTTTFIWQQHAGPATATALCDGEAHRYAAGLAKGETRGGVAFAHLLRQGLPYFVQNHAVMVGSFQERPATSPGGAMSTSSSSQPDGKTR